MIVEIDLEDGFTIIVENERSLTPGIPPALCAVSSSQSVRPISVRTPLREQLTRL